MAAKRSAKRPKARHPAPRRRAPRPKRAPRRAPRQPPKKPPAPPVAKPAPAKPTPAKPSPPKPAQARRPKRRQPESFRARTVTPSLTVADLQQSIGWYQGVLGFHVVSRWEDQDARGVELAAGGIRIMLNQDDWARGRDRHKGEGVRLWLTTVQDIDRLAAEVASRGGALDHEPRVMPWGDRTFAITDPDGYHLTFVQIKS